MSPSQFLDWAIGVSLALLGVVSAALAHDVLTEHRRHDREGE